MAVSIVRVAGAQAASTDTVSVDMDTTDCDYVHAVALWRNDAQTISTFTREGAGMTLVGTDDTDTGERVSCGMRRSASAGTSTDTFAVTLSASTEALRIMVFGLSGVDSGSPVVSADTNANLAGASASLATDSTTVAANNLAISAIVVRDDVSATLDDDGGANTTTQFARALVTGGSFTTYAVSFTTTLTVTYSWTEPGSGNWAKAPTAVYAASAGGGGVVGPLLAGHLTGRGILGGRLH